MRMTSLKTLSLADNQLTGPVPSTIGYLTQLQDLWLSHNLLTGVGSATTCSPASR
jgi:Leucine-rich repeat (LRR) protein